MLDSSLRQDLQDHDAMNDVGCGVDDAMQIKFAPRAALQQARTRVVKPRLRHQSVDDTIGVEHYCVLIGEIAEGLTHRDESSSVLFSNASMGSSSSASRSGMRTSAN